MGNVLYNRRIVGPDAVDDAATAADGGSNANSRASSEGGEMRVFQKHMYGGPLGLGDPNYRGLSKMEEDPLITNRARDISRSFLCDEAGRKLAECATQNRYLMVYQCSAERDALVECMKKWMDDGSFIERVTEEYLNERSHYRQTGEKRLSCSYVSPFPN